MSAEAYERTLRAIEQVIAEETESDEILRRAVDLVHDGFESYSWVGVYFVEGEQLAVIGRELYAWHPDGIARSKLWAALAGGRLGVIATARNWTTVETLAEMAKS